MAIRRISYIFALTTILLFSVLYQYWISVYLVVVVLLIIPFDLFLSLPGMLTKQLHFSLPRIIEQGAVSSFGIKAVGRDYLPARLIIVKMRTENEYGDSKKRFVMGARPDTQHETVIDTRLSGLTTFTVSKMRIVSLLGLFSLSRNVSYRGSVLVLPPPTKPPYTVALPRGIIFRPKPGGGFSENYDMREYRPGDPIRSIHWKISAKHDSIVIREPLIAPPHSRLVKAEMWTNSRERDLILGRLRWVANYLIKWELPFYVKFGDKGSIIEITEPGQLENYLYDELSNVSTPSRNEAHNISNFTWVFKVDAKMAKMSEPSEPIEAMMNNEGGDM